MIDRRQLIVGAVALPLLAAARRPEGPLNVEILSAPEAVLTDTGRIAVYELTLSNFGDGTLSFERIQVADERGSTFLDAAGKSLAARFDAPGPDYGPLKLPYGRIATLYLEVPLPTPVPTALSHDIWYRDPVGKLTLMRTGLRAFDPIPVPRLTPPLRGGPWVAIHSPDWPRGHRRVIYTIGKPRVPGRHAIDFVLTDAEGRIAKGGADIPANALGYGAEVLAVADARVAAVRDGMAESTSVAKNPAHAPDDAAGNFISLDLGSGRYAIYEHLKPGSVRVKKGDRVRTGQVIAALGFTGDTTGPHLHFHVADAAVPLLGEGKGFVFERYERLGTYPDLGDLGSKSWKPGHADCVGQKPSSNSVIRFA